MKQQLLTWPITTSWQPSAWSALDWWDIERNENQSRKMTFRGIKQFASSCRDPGNPRPTRPVRSCSFVFYWTHIKLVNVNKKEIELVFVVSLMKPLLVHGISPLDFPLFAFFCFTWFNVLLGSGSFTFYFQTTEGEMEKGERSLKTKEDFEVSVYRFSNVRHLDPPQTKSGNTSP